MFFAKALLTLIRLCLYFDIPDDEARLGRLRYVCMGQERGPTCQQARPHRLHLRLQLHGRHHCRCHGHPIHHGLHGGVQKGEGLDRAVPWYEPHGEDFCHYLTMFVNWRKWPLPAPFILVSQRKLILPCWPQHKGETSFLIFSMPSVFLQQDIQWRLSLLPFFRLAMSPYLRPTSGT